MQGIQLVVPGPNQVRVEEYEIGEPGPTQIRVRTEVSLVSAGTELAIYTGIHQGLTNPETRWPKYPQPMGYMAVTRVEQVGPGVESVRVGDRLLTSTGHASHALVDAGPGAPRRMWPLPEDAP